MSIGTSPWAFCSHTTCCGSPVTGLAAMGPDVVVATRNCVKLYDGTMKEKGSMNLQAVSVAALRGKAPIVCVADEAGVVRALGR